MTKRIYLAGPDVFLPSPADAAADLKDACAAVGLSGAFPLDAEITASPDARPRDVARQIFQANVALLKSCAGVLVNMTPFRGPSMDVGSAWEMGFAAALGLPVVGYMLTADRLRGYGVEPDLFVMDNEHLWQSYAERVDPYVRRVSENAAPEQPKDGERLVDADGWTVEDFDWPDNLMVACGAAAILPSPEEAAGHLARLLDGLPLDEAALAAAERARLERAIASDQQCADDERRSGSIEVAESFDEDIVRLKARLARL